MNFGTKWCSRMLISNLRIVFVNFLHKIAFGANLVPKLQTTLFKLIRNSSVCNGTRCKGVFKDADFDFDNCYLKFHP